jgi:hypothetical protein
VCDDNERHGVALGATWVRASRKVADALGLCFNVGMTDSDCLVWDFLYIEHNPIGNKSANDENLESESDEISKIVKSSGLPHSVDIRRQKLCSECVRNTIQNDLELSSDFVKALSDFSTATNSSRRTNYATFMRLTLLVLWL